VFPPWKGENTPFNSFYQILRIKQQPRQQYDYGQGENGSHKEYDNQMPNVKGDFGFEY